MKESTEWQIITVNLIIHLGAIGHGLGQQKVPHSRFRVRRITRILKKHSIKKPLWFLLKCSIKTKAIEQEYYNNKVLGMLQIRKKDLELLASLLKHLKIYKSDFLALSICAEIIKNVK